MSERKVLNKYYPPDFDPAKIPRMKLAKNRQYTVRLMAPFNMRCATCGEYIYKGKKFNARKEDVENEDYLGIRIYRFYIKCTRCLQEISFKTDPQNTDYVIEAGATRNFMALKLAEEQAQREEDEKKEEEANNPMKLLEIRTEQSKQEIELLESLEELKELNRRQVAVDYEGMLHQYRGETPAEREARETQEDDQFIKSIKFTNPSAQKVFSEEIIEEVKDEEPRAKVARLESAPAAGSKTTESNRPIAPKKQESWNRSIGVMSKKSSLLNLVKTNPKKTAAEQSVCTNALKNSIDGTKSSPVLNITDKQSCNTEKSKTSITEMTAKTTENKEATCIAASGLSLLAGYSDSDSDE